MTAELLAAIVMSVYALIFAYIPGVKTWYEAKSSEAKAGFMAISLIVITIAIFALTCLGLAASLNITATCDQKGAIELIKILVAALVANQSTYLLLVKPFKKA
jgi:predicted transporter